MVALRRKIHNLYGVFMSVFGDTILRNFGGRCNYVDFDDGERVVQAHFACNMQLGLF